MTKADRIPTLDKWVYTASDTQLRDLAVTNAYARRNSILSRIGYQNYQHYLKSPLWRSIKRRVYEKQGPDCLACGRFASQVHHRFYSEKNLSGQTLAGLIPICSTCHKQAERRPDGSKRSLKEANKQLEPAIKSTWKNKGQNKHQGRKQAKGTASHTTTVCIKCGSRITTKGKCKCRKQAKQTERQKLLDKGEALLKRLQKTA